MGRQRVAMGTVAVLALVVAAGCTTTSGSTPPAAGGSALLTAARNATNDADKITLYRQVLAGDAGNAEANTALGDIYIRQANSGSADRVGSLCSAQASYAAAAQGASGATRANALTRRADALLGLNQAGAQACAGTQDFRNNAAFRDGAIAQYQAAIAADGAPARHFALASAYTNAGMLEQADAAYTAGLGAGAAGAERAAGLAAQASVRSRLPGYSPEQIRATLEEAAAAGSSSPQVNLSLGEIYLSQRDLGQARQAFERVRASGATAAGPGQANPTAEAYYYLSVIDTLDAPNAAKMAAAVQNADAAIDNGGRSARYQRQACLSYIMRGQVAVEGDDAVAYADALTENCAAASGSPDELLLRAFSTLRLAQYNAAAGQEARWRERLTSARSDLSAAVQATQNLSDSGRSLTLPGRQPLWIADLQDYGARVINVCFGVPADPNDPFTPDRSARADIEGFYRDYRLNICRT